jgi:predicted HNH restriction endonuclease
MNSPSLLEATHEAFTSFSVSQIRVLHALLFARDHSASAGQLRTLLGLPAVIQVNAAIGQAGRKVFKILGRHPDGLNEGEFQWWTVLATGHWSAQGDVVWTLRPEVAAALAAHLPDDIGLRMAEEAGAGHTLIEGAFRKVLVNAYERNPVARARCLEFYGCCCAVCRLNFGERYGPKAEGFIHVHHLRQLSDIGQEYEVDPIQDLRPVCPNCHAVIHLADPPYTIEQVQALLSRSGTSAEET